MPRFYLDPTYCNDCHSNTELILTKEIVHHIQVLRLKPQHVITLFDGQGNSYLATIIDIKRNQVIVQIKKQHNKTPESRLVTNLLLCIIANDRMDLAIQKAVELGVANITPVISSHAQKIAQEKIANRLQHWQQIIINSCCQCGNNYLPKIVAPINFAKLIANHANLIDFNNHSTKIILTTEAQPTNGNLQSKFKQALNINLPEKTYVDLLVGPEGGFSRNEVDQAIDNGFIPITLGSTNAANNLILRSETAVIAGLTLINLKFGWYE